MGQEINFRRQRGGKKRKVKKKKKKVKPGYKKKIQWAVDEKRRKNKRVEARAKGRAERKAKHQTF